MNREIALKTIKLDTLKLNDRNPRTIKGEAFQRLCDSIKRDPEFVPLRPIVVDAKGVILGGNMRYRACLQLGMTEVPETWVRRADKLTPEQRRRFVLVDNAPEGMSGEWDFDILAADWELPELKALGFDGLMRELEGDEGSDKYTNKIEIPTYEPKSEKPSVQALYDANKTKRLIDEIEKAEIDQDEKEFLRTAAQRHTVFNFKQIAEYYCHANAVTQDLFEKSGLVIIDFEKAIEYGFVRLTERLLDLAGMEESEDA